MAWQGARGHVARYRWQVAAGRSGECCCGKVHVPRYTWQVASVSRSASCAAVEMCMWPSAAFNLNHEDLHQNQTHYSTSKTLLET